MYCITITILFSESIINMVLIFQIHGETKIEIPNADLDMRYYEKEIKTDLDRFLEDPIAGNLRMWHLIMMVSGAVTIASKVLFV